MTADNLIRKIFIINRGTNYAYKDCRRKTFLKIDDMICEYLGLTEDLDCELLCEDIEKMIIDDDWMDKYISWKGQLSKSPIE